MSQSSTRSSTPVRLYSSRMGSSSRTNLPQPKVLPFPDLPVRTSMSRPHSRPGSPLASPPTVGSPPHISPGLSSSGGAAPEFAFPSTGANTSTASTSESAPAISGLPHARSSSVSPASSSLNLPEGLLATARVANSLSPPNPSPLGLTSPRPNRPRAATTVATVTTSIMSRQEGFIPSRPATPQHPQGSSLSSSSTHATTSQVVVAGSGLAGSAITNTVPAAPATILRASIPDDQPAASTIRHTPSQRKANPPAPLPASVPVTPPVPPSGLVDHLYRSLKTGVCADVRIWVRKWGVAWHVHKMVLVQAGFFHSLFMGGFSEGARRKTKGKNKAGAALPDDDWTGEDIELTFDDPNITRAAFEICLSRLYSSYPQLHFPVSMLPTAAQPLTPAFPSSAGFPSIQSTYHAAAENTHLVTPRLLLSLLATATYLGHQYLLREALAIVLRTVGPSSVGRYLNFAIGVGIGEEEWEGQDDEGARGMEKVARQMSFNHDSDEWITESDEGHLPPHERMPRESTASSNTSDDHIKVSGIRFESPSRSASMRSNDTARPDGMPDEAAPFHFYGFLSNKIGEACVCWLTRWGLDILNVEAGDEDLSTALARDAAPVWGQGGIPAKFARAVLCSDALFVPNEMERYTMARRVLDLRRSTWMAIAEAEDIGEPGLVAEPESIEGWDEDEEEIAKVFAEGIYYSHMTFDDLSCISADVDPATALPYAPLTVLQAAHWAAADLKTRITHDRAPPAAAEGELGLTQTISEISSIQTRRRAPRSRLASPSIYGSGAHTTMSFSSLSLSSMGYTSPMGDGVFHPVPQDDTHRIGAGGLLFFNHNAVVAPLPSIPGMPDMGPEWGGGEDKNAKGKPRAPPQGERTFFGIKRGTMSASEIDAKFREEGGTHIALPGLDKSKEERYSKVEPYRFSVEFWDVDKLADKGRLYSATHFYAGSYFNVYVSTIRKKDKGVQLGIYLHRQSTTEPFPPINAHPSTNDSPTFTSVPFEPIARANTLPAGSDLYRAVSQVSPVVGSPLQRVDALPEEDVPRREPGAGSYLDPRPVTKAYFSISCASALGTALVRFSSAPDSFALSQSWGWKSSALRSEEYLSVPVSDGESALGWVGESEGGSLRATVVVGVI